MDCTGKGVMPGNGKGNEKCFLKLQQGGFFCLKMPLRKDEIYQMICIIKIAKSIIYSSKLAFILATLKKMSKSVIMV